ncbi:hypothetical protein DIPPA_61475, partial [Diplonema papillatum]
MEWGEQDSLNPSSRKTAKGVGRGGDGDKLFPMLLAMGNPARDTPLSGVVTAISLAVETCQQLAFVVNPRFGFSITVVDQLTYFIYSSHIPIWDKTYANVRHDEYLVWYWLAVVPVLAATAFVVCGVLEYFERGSRTWLSLVMVPVFHASGTVLAIPFLQAYAARTFCHERHLWAFPEKECWTMEGTLYFCFSIVVGLLLVFVML